MVGVAALALTLVVRRPRRGELHAVAVALFDLTLDYLLVGALWFQPWYLVPLVGLAALLDRARRVVAIAYAIGATASYVVYFYVWLWLGRGYERLVVQGLAVAVAHGRGGLPARSRRGSRSPAHHVRAADCAGRDPGV